MEPLDGVDVGTVLSGDIDWITPGIASRLAAYPLDCVETEFPHAVWSVDSLDDVVRPREQHPVFYGCYDWHSSVHCHWSLVRLLRLIDDLPERSEITRSLDRRFTSENVERECAYLDRNVTFEKPYGWGWFLRLAAEIHLRDDDRAEDWRGVLSPLETRVVELVEDEFLSQGRPFRVGTHHNSAFALACVLDYARVTSAGPLEAATLDTAERFFERDRDAPVAYEPLGWDFLSPSLVEADLMRRVLDRTAFSVWVDGFLPDVTSHPYDSILQPVAVSRDPDEDVALHLVGLNLSRGWCLAGIASSLDDHAYENALERSARCHAEYGLERAFTGEYAGAHWLSTFVLYLLTRHAGGIAPE